MIKVKFSREGKTITIDYRSFMILVGMFMISSGNATPDSPPATQGPDADGDTRRPASKHRQVRPQRQRNAARPELETPFASAFPTAPEKPVEPPTLVPQETQPVASPDAPCKPVLPEAAWSSFIPKPGPLSQRPELALREEKVGFKSGRTCRTRVLSKP